MKALIVDDDETIAFILTEYLVSAGWNADTAHNGSQAVELAEKSFYDLVLMDIYMPAMDGIEATSRILQLAPKTKIIAITSSHEVWERQRMMAAGCCDFLLKPLFERKLLELLDEHVPHVFVRPFGWIISKHVSEQFLFSEYLTLSYVKVIGKDTAQHTLANLSDSINLVLAIIHEHDLDVIRCIKKMRDQFPKIVIIAVSPWDTPEIKKEAFDHGVNEFLLMPVDLGKLRKTVAKYF
jgi:CheY-like chemotaxis protein